MSQKYLIAAIFLLFAAGTVFLFWQNARELDPDQGKSWWTLAFAFPENSQSLAFEVENHSAETTFQYEITTGKMLIARENFVVDRGEQTTVTPAFAAKTGEQTKITVILGAEKKEIYR
jgi:hypothetical protein